MCQSHAWACEEKPHASPTWCLLWETAHRGHTGRPHKSAQWGHGGGCAQWAHTQSPELGGPNLVRLASAVSGVFSCLLSEQTEEGGPGSGWCRGQWGAWGCGRPRGGQKPAGAVLRCGRRVGLAHMWAVILAFASGHGGW